MSIADKRQYLKDIVIELKKGHPDNRRINIVFHGHSVPSGYFATPMVDTFNAYPHLCHRALKERFPFAVINAIVTGVGGENSESGAKRFRDEVLCHRPDVVTIDYGLNDRRIGLEKAEQSWGEMIEAAARQNIKVLLLTPTVDLNETFDENSILRQHAQLIRSLAERYEVGIADSYAAFEHYIKAGGEHTELLSWVNHPNRKGHELVTTEIMKWFPVV